MPRNIHRRHTEPSLIAAIGSLYWKAPGFNSLSSHWLLFKINCAISQLSFSAWRSAGPGKKFLFTLTFGWGSEEVKGQCCGSRLSSVFPPLRQPMSVRTCNIYLYSMPQFCLWLRESCPAQLPCGIWGVLFLCPWSLSSFGLTGKAEQIWEGQFDCGVGEYSLGPGSDFLIHLNLCVLS